jgi:hypothetical protein
MHNYSYNYSSAHFCVAHKRPKFIFKASVNMFSNTTKSFLLEETYFGEKSWALNTTMFAGVIFLGLELLTHVVDFFFSRSSKIEARGKRLDPLEVIDWSCIYANRCITVVFVYHLITVNRCQQLAFL